MVAQSTRVLETFVDSHAGHASRARGYFYALDDGLFNKAEQPRTVVRHQQKYPWDAPNSLSENLADGWQASAPLSLEQLKTSGDKLKRSTRTAAMAAPPPAASACALLETQRDALRKDEASCLALLQAADENKQQRLRHTLDRVRRQLDETDKALVLAAGHRDAEAREDAYEHVDALEGDVASLRSALLQEKRRRKDAEGLRDEFELRLDALRQVSGEQTATLSGGQAPQTTSTWAVPTKLRTIYVPTRPQPGDADDIDALRAERDAIDRDLNDARSQQKVLKDDFAKRKTDWLEDQARSFPLSLGRGGGAANWTAFRSAFNACVFRRLLFFSVVDSVIAGAPILYGCRCHDDYDLCLDPRPVPVPSSFPPAASPL